MTRPDRQTLWLVAPIAMALTPHGLYVPVWVSLAVALVLAWRLGPLWRKDSLAQKSIRILLAGAGLTATWLQFHTLAGPEAGISLLVQMVALKLLESDGRRDHAAAVLAGYFLVMATLIHHQQLAAAAWLLLTTAVLTASLVASQTNEPVRLNIALASGGSLVLQALPLAILMFLLFPRLPSPMAGLVHVETGRTGLSDSMAPGSVSRLILSDEIALRVDFADPRTDARRFYWRGPVLADFDGRTWQRGGNIPEPPVALPVGGRIDYTVTLEASEQPWLPVAGLTRSLPVPGAWLTAYQEWLTPRRGHERLRYEVQSWLDYRLETELPAWQRRQALALPGGDNPDSQALARRWADASASPREIVDRALAYFRREPFRYTLSPPPLGEHGVDDFLFLTRSGFCEHYAGAFTVLMRAAGVPARVVTGYQGGERNPVGGYWIVRQRDAHAWAEVWLAGSGWVRVDPTAAVAPERVEKGLADALPAAERPLLELPGSWLRPWRQAWDYMNNGWNQWVLGYDFQRQRRLLASLSPSLASLKGMLWAMLAGVGLILGGLALMLLRDTAGAPRSEVERLYARFLERLAKAGLDKGRAEGPADFAARAGRDRPDLAGQIHAVTRSYIALRYGGGKNGMAELRNALHTFSQAMRRRGHSRGKLSSRHQEITR